MSKSLLTAALNDPDAPVADFALSSRRLPSAQVEDVLGTVEIAQHSASLSAASNYLSSTPASIKAGSFVKVRASTLISHMREAATALILRGSGAETLVGRVPRAHCVQLPVPTVSPAALSAPSAPALSRCPAAWWLRPRRSRRSTRCTGCARSSNTERPGAGAPYARERYAPELDGAFSRHTSMRCSANDFKMQCG